MTRLAIIFMTAVFSLAGCSEKTQKKTDEAVESVGTDIERGTERAVDKVEDTAHGLGERAKEVGQDVEEGARNVADKVGDKVGEAGDAVEKATDNNQ